MDYYFCEALQSNDRWYSCVSQEDELDEERLRAILTYASVDECKQCSNVHRSGQPLPGRGQAPPLPYTEGSDSQARVW